MRKDSILANYYYKRLPKAEDGLEYKGHSIVDFLATKGYSGKKAFRKELAQKYGIEGYDFSAKKNIELLNKIKESEDVLREYQPSFAPISVEEMEEKERIRKERKEQEAEARRIRRRQQEQEEEKRRKEETPKTLPNKKTGPSGGYVVGRNAQGREVYMMPPNVRAQVFASPVQKPASQTTVSKVGTPLVYALPPQQQQGLGLFPWQKQQIQTPPPPPPSTRKVVSPTTKKQVSTPKQGVPLVYAPAPQQQTLPIFPWQGRQVQTPSSTPVSSPVSSPTPVYAPQSRIVPSAENFYSQFHINPKTGKYTLLPGFMADQTTGQTSRQAPVKEPGFWESAGNAVTDFFGGVYDQFSQAVKDAEKQGFNLAPRSLSGTGITPQGAVAITRDFNENVVYPSAINIASLFSEDLAQKIENKTKRMMAMSNTDLEKTERKSQIDPYKSKFDPVYLTGNVIKDNDRRYHTPELIDLDFVRFGIRNRGDYREIPNTEGGVITAFDPFVNSRQYFAVSKDPANATYLGVSADGKVKVGGKQMFQDQDYMISRTFGNKVIDFNRDESGKIKRVTPNPKATTDPNIVSPSVKVMEDDGSIVEGKLNLLLPKNDEKGESFDLVTGGRYIFQTPDGKRTKLVSGSLKDLEAEFYKMKKNHPYINIITLDNGSYSRGIRTFDKKLTSKDLRKYDNQNSSGGGNVLYILPGSQKSRYESKFFDFENEAKKLLQKEYPGRKVEVRFQNTGLYDEFGGRDISSQLAIQKAGNSQTPASLHNFNAARDYMLVVDGKIIDADDNKELYKKVLWNAADKAGVYHLEDWDPTHISLAKEGQKTAFDELFDKYPDLFDTENFRKSYDFIMKNKDNPTYSEFYELLSEIQPFTGKPRVTRAMQKSKTQKKKWGGEPNQYFYNKGYGVPQFANGGQSKKQNGPCPKDMEWSESLQQCVFKDTKSQAYRDAYENKAVGYYDDNGVFIDQSVNLPEIVAYPRNFFNEDTKKFYDNLTNEQRYVYDQLGKKYGYPKVRYSSSSGPFGLYEETAGHFNPLTNTTTINKKEPGYGDIGTYISELSHKVDFDKMGKFDRYGKWITHDLVDYITGNDPYRTEGDLEHHVHENIEPKILEEAFKYRDEFLLNDPSYRQKYGGDISLPNVYPNQMVPRLEEGGDRGKKKKKGTQQPVPQPFVFDVNKNTVIKSASPRDNASMFVMPPLSQGQRVSIPYNEDFNKSGITAKNFLNNWYQARVNDPRYGKVAKQRIAEIPNIKTVVVSPEEMKKMDAAGYYTRGGKNIYLDPSNYPQSSVNIHESTHELYDQVPQKNQDEIIKKFLIDEKSWRERNEGDYSYFSDPTEVAARLNQFRRLYNIDPRKKYTAEEMRKIINRHKKTSYNINIFGEPDSRKHQNWNFGDSNIDELLEMIGRDPAKLAQLNDEIVMNLPQRGMNYGKMGGTMLEQKAYGGPLVEYYKGKMTGPNIFKQGGSTTYNKGEEYELSDAEIKQLIKKGYKIKYI